MCLMFTITACSELFVPDLSEETLIVIAPKDSLVTAEKDIVFYWEHLEGASEYELQIVEPSFDAINAFVLDTLITENKVQIRLADGMYQWRIRASNGPSESPYIVRYLNITESINQVDLFSPINNYIVADTSLVLRWLATVDAKYYEVEVNTTKDFLETDLIYSATETNTFTNLNLSENGMYYWRVRAYISDAKLYTEYSEVWSFDINPDYNISKTTITLLSPADSLYSNKQNISFSWNVLQQATDYQIDIASKEDFNAEQLFESVLTTDTVHNYAFTEEGIYYWRVKGLNTQFISEYSSIRRLDIDYTNPSPPLLISPLNQESIAGDDVLLIWESDPTAFTDSLYIYESNTSNELIKTAVSNQEYLFAIPNSGIYYWQVQSYDKAGNKSGWTVVYSFVRL